MTVREMIAKLAEFPHDATVVHESYEDCDANQNEPEIEMDGAVVKILPGKPL